MHVHARLSSIHACAQSVRETRVFSVSDEWGHISYLAHTTSAQLTPFFKLFDALPLH